MTGRATGIALMVVGIVVATLSAVFYVKARDARLIDEGDARGAARVQTKWNTAEAKRQADEMAAAARAAAQRLVDEQAERAKEQAKQRDAERIANEHAQRTAAAEAAAARTLVRNRSLLDTIAELDARNAELSRAAPDARADAIAREAATARELLGRCSGRYAAVAADADQLRDQVIGLQDFAAAVCHAPQLSIIPTAQ